MQVQPIVAIRPMRIRPKPVTALAESRDTKPAPASRFPSIIKTAIQNQSTFSEADKYFGVSSKYSAQLLASRLDSGQTRMDRSGQMARYTTANRQSISAATLSLSV